MFCSKCGTENNDFASNCIKCAAPLQKAQSGSAAGQAIPNNYLVQAILATIFCCLPFGIKFWFYPYRQPEKPWPKPVYHPHANRI